MNLQHKWREYFTEKGVISRIRCYRPGDLAAQKTPTTLVRIVVLKQRRWKPDIAVSYRENEEVKTTNPNNSFRSLAMKSSYNGGEFGWIEGDFIWDTSHICMPMQMISEGSGKWQLQEGQGMIAKAKFLRKQDNMSFCDAVHSGEVVPYGHRDCWNDVTSGKIEPDRTRRRKIRQTSANCFYILSEFINRTKVISWEWS